MAKRQLGRSGIEVEPLALGGNVFGWNVDQQGTSDILDAFTGAGLNLVDTADVYSKWIPGNSGGESETLIGHWLKKPGNRDKVVIATKVGAEFAPDKKGLAKDYIFQSVEDSLRRLQTDYIDLYQSHRDDESVPQEETLQAYAKLIESGKVRAIGASNFSAARLKESIEISERLGIPRYETLQPNYNLYDREDYESNLESTVLENHIGVIPYFSLAMGFLTGKYRSEADLSKSPRGGGIGPKYLNPRGFAILAALDKVSEKHTVTPAQVALAWLMARPSITAPIASATSVSQLNEIAASTRLTLDSDDIAALNEASKAA